MNKIGLKILQQIDPEDAHDLAIKALKYGLVSAPKMKRYPQLQQTLWGQTFSSPIGIAAGFDKNARVYPKLVKFGFGFIEVGAVTPRPQAGNPKPRLFRLKQDHAVINRFGFNNDGMVAIQQRLQHAKSLACPIWVNIGANKDSTDRIEDYKQVLSCLAPYVNGVTLNVSSPNTQNLRHLQQADALNMLVTTCRDALTMDIPLFVKIAPDLEKDDLRVIVASVEQSIHGIIATNTTLDRHNLHSSDRHEAGGLSGRPLFEKSTQILRDLYTLTQGKITLIGVGGVEDAQTAYAKIKAGASLVQLYTALVYKGLDLCAQINQGLVALLERDGLNHVSEAVGKDH
jgi:dihydroorotate dehydrogenase